MQLTSVYVADPDELIAASLQRRHAGPHLAVIHCASVAELLDQLEPDSAVCIVADASLPDMGMLELLARLRSLSVHAPVLCISEDCGVPTAVALMKAGAYDCIEKTGPTARLLEKLDAFIEEAFDTSS